MHSQLAQQEALNSKDAWELSEEMVDDSEVKICATCGDRCGRRFMAFDKVHCSEQCRDNTLDVAMDGDIPDFMEFAEEWSARDQEERYKRETDELRRLAEERERQREMRMHQLRATGDHLRVENDDWSVWNMPMGSSYAAY